MGVKVTMTANRVLVATRQRELGLVGPTGIQNEVLTQQQHYNCKEKEQGLANKLKAQKKILAASMANYKPDEDHQRVLQAQDKENCRQAVQAALDKQIDLEWEAFQHAITTVTPRHLMLSREKTSLLLSIYRFVCSTFIFIVTFFSCLCRGSPFSGGDVLNLKHLCRGSPFPGGDALNLKNLCRGSPFPGGDALNLKNLCRGSLFPGGDALNQFFCGGNILVFHWHRKADV